METVVTPTRRFGFAEPSNWLDFVLVSLEDQPKATKPHAFETGHSTEVLRQIVSGLQFLHQKHIAHRDLKPVARVIGNLRFCRFALASFYIFGLKRHPQ